MGVSALGYRWRKRRWRFNLPKIPKLGDRWVLIQVFLTPKLTLLLILQYCPVPFSLLPPFSASWFSPTPYRSRAYSYISSLLIFIAPSGMSSCSQLGSNPAVFGGLPNSSKAQCSLHKPESTNPIYWTPAGHWWSHGVGRGRNNESKRVPSRPSVLSFDDSSLGLSRPYGESHTI